MEGIRFLASYKDDNVIITVTKTENIIDDVKKGFSLPEKSSVKLQVFDKDFNEWVNKDPKEILNKDKVRVMVKSTQHVASPGIVNLISDLESIASTSQHIPQEEATFSFPDDLPEVCLEAEYDDERNFSNIIESTSASNSEDSFPTSPQPVTQEAAKQTKQVTPSRMDRVSLKPWPVKFPIPVNSMPADLRKALEEGTYPNERQRRKLVQLLFDKTAEYARFPTKSQYNDVATALVEQYPCLAFSDIPSVKPHEYWKTKLSDKFRNERKHSIDGQMKAQTKKKKLADLPVDTEDERSIDMHQRWMKEELKKKTKNTGKIAELMKLTFPARRRDIVEEKALVKMIREKYPALFQTDELLQEFQRITGKEVFPTLRNNLSAISSKIIKLAEKREPQKKLLRSLELQQIFTVEKDKKTELENTCAVFILSRILSSKSHILCKEEGGNMNFTAPTIVWKGETPLNAEGYTIQTENESFAETHDGVVALGCLVATYWVFNMTYPKHSMDFFCFAEIMLLKLDSVKPTRSVNNLISQLKAL